MNSQTCEFVHIGILVTQIGRTHQGYDWWWNSSSFSWPVAVQLRHLDKANAFCAWLDKKAFSTSQCVAAFALQPSIRRTELETILESDEGRLNCYDVSASAHDWNQGIVNDVEIGLEKWMLDMSGQKLVDLHPQAIRILLLQLFLLVWLNPSPRQMKDSCCRVVSPFVLCVANRCLGLGPFEPGDMPETRLQWVHLAIGGRHWSHLFVVASSRQETTQFSFASRFYVKRYGKMQQPESCGLFSIKLIKLFLLILSNIPRFFHRHLFAHPRKIHRFLWSWADASRRIVAAGDVVQRAHPGAAATDETRRDFQWILMALYGFVVDRGWTCWTWGADVTLIIQLMRPFIFRSSFRVVASSHPF